MLGVDKEGGRRQADISKSISKWWKAMPQDEKKFWYGLAEEKREEHRRLHPSYVYQPSHRVKRTTRLHKERREEEVESDGSGDTTQKIACDSQESFVMGTYPHASAETTDSAACLTKSTQEAIQNLNSCPSASTLEPDVVAAFDANDIPPLFPSNIFDTPPPYLNLGGPSTTSLSMSLDMSNLTHSVPAESAPGSGFGTAGSAWDPIWDVIDIPHRQLHYPCSGPSQYAGVL